MCFCYLYGGGWVEWIIDYLCYVCGLSGDYVEVIECKFDVFYFVDFEECV